MTKRTERFDPARDGALSPHLPPVRKLINEVDELAIDKVKSLVAAKIRYAENVRNAHRTLGGLRKLNKPNMRCVKVYILPCYIRCTTSLFRNTKTDMTRFTLPNQ